MRRYLRLGNRSTRSYLAAIVGALGVFTAERIVDDGAIRYAIADFAWTAAALAAVLGTYRATRRARGDAGLSWLFIFAGSSESRAPSSTRAFSRPLRSGRSAWC